MEAEAEFFRQPDVVDLSDAPAVPEERWRDEAGKLDESLMLVSASGRFNGPWNYFDYVHQ